MPCENYSAHKFVRPKKVLLLEFETLENLIFFVGKFFFLCKKFKIKSDLYKFNGKYIILLRINPRHVKTVLKLSSLADRMSAAALDIAVTEEHAKLITENCAVDKIGASFSGNF